MSIDKAIKDIEIFQGNSLTESLAKIEREIIGYDSINSHIFCDKRKINNAFMDSALSIKKSSGDTILNYLTSM